MPRQATFAPAAATGPTAGNRRSGNRSSPPPVLGGGSGIQPDHVLVSRDFSANSARFLDIAGTDHRALAVDVTLHRRN